MENKILTRPDDMEAWLHAMKISCYALHRDEKYGYCVDVDQNVDLDDQNIFFFPLKFRSVSGFFHCNNNYLTSLLGAPDTVGEAFECGNNRLQSLKYGPQTVNGYFDCEINSLSSLEFCPIFVGTSFYCTYNRLTSLKYAPSVMYDDFLCHNNLLTNLQYCPEHIQGQLWCNDNRIESLEFFPQRVEGKIFLDHNPLLGSAQNIQAFDEIKAIQIELLRIRDEHLLLNQKIPEAQKIKSSNHKI